MSDVLQWIRENTEWLFIGGGIALVFFIVFIANKIRMEREFFAAELEDTGLSSAEITRVPITLETKKAASLYRLKDKNIACLMLHVLIESKNIETTTIRIIQATMGNEEGIMVQKKFTALATYLGRKSSYSFGSSENILPLSITGNTPRNAYLCFAFSNADIKIGNVALKIITSKGENVVPLEVDVIG